MCSSLCRSRHLRRGLLDALQSKDMEESWRVLLAET